MTPLSFTTFYEQSGIIIGEGAVIERLRRETEWELDPHVVNSAFVYDPAKRSALETIYRQYLEVGFSTGLPSESRLMDCAGVAAVKRCRYMR